MKYQIIANGAFKRPSNHKEKKLVIKVNFTFTIVQSQSIIVITDV